MVIGLFYHKYHVDNAPIWRIKSLVYFHNQALLEKKNIFTSSHLNMGNLLEHCQVFQWDMKAVLPYTKLYNFVKIYVCNLDQQFAHCIPCKESKHVQGISDRFPVLLASQDRTYQNLNAEVD